MQIHRLSYQVKGFVRLADYALNWAYMITEKAKHKARVLAFWQKYGLEATIEAFKVKERTLYYWQAQLKLNNGKLESLNEKSRRPKKVRQRQWPDEVINKIRQLRKEHPNLGKDKIFIFLNPYCQVNKLKCPAVSPPFPICFN